MEKWADRAEPEDLNDANPEDSREILELLDESADVANLLAHAPDTDLRQRPGSTEPTKR